MILKLTMRSDVIVYFGFYFATVFSVGNSVILIHSL